MKKFLLILLSIFCLLNPAAVSATTVPEIADDPLTLTIDFYKESSTGSRIALDGATFSVYRVADMEVENGGPHHTVIKPFDSLAKTEGGNDVTFDGMTEKESNIFAKKANKLAKEADAEGTTDSNGFAKIEIQEKGMYLVAETGKTGTAAKYTDAEPFLVSVPLAEEQGDTVQWQYSVTAMPKTAVNRTDMPDSPSTTSESDTSSATQETKDHPEESTAPGTSAAKGARTGDSSNTEAWFFALILAAEAAIVLGIAGRRKKN